MPRFSSFGDNLAKADLINGVRFNNSTFRPGANQYTALIVQDFADRVEVVHGPGSTQYGSDSLGGTINVLTQSPQGADSFGIHGHVNTYFASADLSAGLSTNVTGASNNWGFLFSASGRRTQDLRTGGGLDSHSVVTRLLGLSSKFLGNRLRDTAYGQYNANAKLQFKTSDADVLSFEYLRGTQLGLRRYDQLDGGIGNLLNSFDPQVLDFFSARYDSARSWSIRFRLSDLFVQRTARRSSLAEHQQRAGASLAHQR